MSNNIPKCKSKTIPCPAGERCPQHRGLIRVVAEALKDEDTGRYLDAKAALDEEEKKKRKAFISRLSIRQKGNGDIVVRTNVESVLSATFEDAKGNPYSTHLFPHGGEKVVIPAPSIEDRVDKTRPIELPYSSAHKTTQQRFQQALEDLYEGRVGFEEKSMGSAVAVDGISMHSGMKGKGVEKHVIMSWMFHSRSDLYDFYGSDAGVPAQTYLDLGFEPNPNYWAGKKHPVTGYEYPSKETLDALSDREQNQNSHLYMSFYSAGYSDERQYPWMRPKFSIPFTELPTSVDEANSLTRGELNSLLKKQSSRATSLLAARRLAAEGKPLPDKI